MCFFKGMSANDKVVGVWVGGLGLGLSANGIQTTNPKPPTND